METLELANRINDVLADDISLHLVAKLTDDDFISIFSYRSGETWATMHASVFQPEVWKCYTEFPDKMLYLLKLAAPVFGNSKTEWPNNFDGEAYFEVDIGYRIREEAVTLTNGERLKGWVVSPPEIADPRVVEYNLIADKNERHGRFCFWQLGKVVRILKNSEVKKIEVINEVNNAD